MQTITINNPVKIEFESIGIYTIFRQLKNAGKDWLILPNGLFNSLVSSNKLIGFNNILCFATEEFLNYYKDMYSGQNEYIEYIEKDYLKIKELLENDKTDRLVYFKDYGYAHILLDKNSKPIIRNLKIDKYIVDNEYEINELANKIKSDNIGCYTEKLISYDCHDDCYNCPDRFQLHIWYIPKSETHFLELLVKNKRGYSVNNEKLLEVIGLKSILDEFINKQMERGC